MALPKPQRDVNKNSTANTADETAWIAKDNETSKNTNSDEDSKTISRRTTSIILNEPLLKALKLYCVEHDLKLNRVIEEAIYSHFVSLLDKQKISVSDQEKESWFSKTK